MAEFHMQKGYGFFISGTSMMLWCTIGLFSVVAAWLVGGTEFKDSIFGDAAIAVFFAGLVVGAILTYWGQTHGHRRLN
jgi:hypothetical protein